MAYRLESGSELTTDEVDSIDDLAYNEVQRLRAMQKTPRDTRYSGPIADRVRFMWDVHMDAFRKGFWDFTWLLEEGVRQNLSWSADYCAVDEINDLNALQATIVSRLSGKLIEYVGDLDQAIYGFAGVDPKQILSILPHDQIEMMEHSYRLTDPIAKTAEQCLRQASWRTGGLIKTTREGGVYHEKQLIENALLAIRGKPDVYGDIYVLSRTNWLASKAQALAIKYGLNVAKSGEEQVLAEFCELIKNPGPTLSYRFIPTLTSSFLPSNQFYKAKAKANLTRLYEAEPDGWMEWSTFYEQYGTERLKRAIEGNWREWYYERVIDPSKPIARFDTFHASKGMEAKTVLILTDIPERVVTEGSPDEEIRLAYVAITRAKDHAFPVSLAYGEQNRYVPLGRREV